MSTGQLPNPNYRTRLTIAGAEVTITLRVKSDGSGHGVIVVQERDEGGHTVYVATERQQRYYCNEFNYRLLGEDEHASYDAITAWLGNELEKA